MLAMRWSCFVVVTIQIFEFDEADALLDWERS